MMQYKIEIKNNQLHIIYFGELFINNSESVSIVYGYTNNWENTKTEPMNKTEDGFVMDIKTDNYDLINFCFSNEKGIWDNNNGKNYSICIVKTDEESNISEYKDSGLLLISEIQGKVFLPYTSDEIKELIQSEENEYTTSQEVIDNVFTKPFSYYRNPFTSRFRESVELITKREQMTLKDGINLGTELFGKKYLHPAIISACKNLDELNVYLDCLDKNELDDFKVFNIVYEMRPMVVKTETALYEKTSIFKKILDFIKSLFTKKELPEPQYSETQK